MSMHPEDRRAAPRTQPRVLGALAVGSLLLLGCRACGKEGPTSSSTPPVPPSDIREGECRPEQTEPWPDARYVEPTGESPFRLFARGPHHILEQVGTAALIHRYPRIAVLEPNGPRALPDLPVPAPEPPRVIDAIAGSVDRLVVEIDKERHYTGATDQRIRAVLDGNGWRVNPVPVAESGYRLVTWAGGRALSVRDADMTWIAPSQIASLEVGAGPEGCKHGSFNFVDDAAIVGETTFLVGRGCPDGSLHVLRFAKGSTRGEAVAPFPFRFLLSQVVFHSESEWFVAGNCYGEGSQDQRIDDGCYAHHGPNGWERVAGPPITRQGLAYGKDGTLWLIVGGDGDIGSGSGHGGGPTPLGEVLRRASGDREWTRIPMPRAPLGDDWTEKRFVAEQVATSGDDVWISGFWFYVRKTAPTRMQTTRRWGLLRLGHHGAVFER